MSDWPVLSEEDRGGRVGVHIFGTKVHKLLKWVFRETSSSDIGIDGEIEIRNDDKTSHGRIVSVQIKCGASFLKEQCSNGYIYRGSMKHLRYWLAHSTPVIVALCDPESEICWWEVIDLQKINLHEKGWSIEIPHLNEVNFLAQKPLVKVANRLQKKDLVEILLRDWIGWSFEHEMKLASSLVMPRDYHWFSNLGMIKNEYYMIDYVLADIDGFKTEEIETMLYYAISNYEQYRYTNLLIAFISESVTLLQNIPEPRHINGIRIEYIPLLLELNEEPKLLELGKNNKLIAYYDLNELLDNWINPVESLRKIM